ncbi:DNA repair protein RadA [Mobiluncus curtisii]|uniref:DNA repair protein RadA n=1 Tax=Mobiluncus curtisii TaxID=2051 RepID=A0A7Y0UH05_9ACTO|nr:AAA family ATPase [Mobiluncus curtisii]MCU9986429.1 DNA repair protein RadA [Mobiluncus curtisii]MCV0000157.1 DNA repair protein RadA [Mobiluncus curtisii]MCV0020134.1 DNA repair protein RadA [Mobiluncus curtisii]NMW47599.1 DNA repair protein RadA [Mobiluncus curtisii]NMW48727.1 DNA repair protein RadA [Mobiluncus curtisii]
MAKEKTVYVCSSCGEEWPKWTGQCRSCGQWGTLEENVVLAKSSARTTGSGTARSTGSYGRPASPAKPIGHYSTERAVRLPTGVGEFDRVLSGGIVPGAVILLAGEPGIGKSTLLLEVAARIAQGTAPRSPRVSENSPGLRLVSADSETPATMDAEGKTVLYLTGEETAEAVLSRAKRIGGVAENLYLAAETQVSQALAQIETTSPDVTIVDSIQTLTDPTMDTSIGGPAQVREVTARLIDAAKSRHMALILVGHVTKDGAVAGPRTLEHLVDVVCQFEGERTGELRLLRAVKNRYGPTDAVGFFQMVESGIEGIEDPSGLFLSKTAEPVPGACVTMSLEGRRALPIEIEALTTPIAGGSPRRTVSGLDYSRTAMMLAVLQARLKLPFGTLDAYVSTVGGARAVEPAVDLAVALAAASAVTGQVIDPGLVAFGEVSLTGEIRSCTAVSRRVAEAARLGFTGAIVPAAATRDLKTPRGFKIQAAANLREAMSLALRRAPASPPDCEI